MDLAAVFPANSTQQRECHISKFWTKSTHIWAALGFWAPYWGHGWKTVAPHMAQKLPAPDAV
jgi:hypothetical protein